METVVLLTDWRPLGCDLYHPFASSRPVRHLCPRLEMGEVANRTRIGRPLTEQAMRRKTMRPVGTERKSPSQWPTGKFFYPFLCQISFLVLFPYFDRPGLPLILFRFLVAATFVSAVYPVSERRAQWLTALVFSRRRAQNTVRLARRSAHSRADSRLYLAVPCVCRCIMLRAVLRSTAVTPPPARIARFSSKVDYFRIAPIHSSSRPRIGIQIPS